jgi:hypothetical protein
MTEFTQAKIVNALLCDLFGHEKFSRLSRRLETAFSINWIIPHAVVAIASNDFHRRSVSVAQRYKQERLMGAVMVRCPQTGRDIPTGLVTDRKSFDYAGLLRTGLLPDLPDASRVVRQRSLGVRGRAAPGAERGALRFVDGGGRSPHHSALGLRKRRRRAPRDQASAASLAEMMRSGSTTGSPRLILSTFPMPSVT